MDFCFGLRGADFVLVCADSAAVAQIIALKARYRAERGDSVDVAWSRVEGAVVQAPEARGGAGRAGPERRAARRGVPRLAGTGGGDAAAVRPRRASWGSETEEPERLSPGPTPAGADPAPA